MVGNDDTVEALKSLENINKILGKNVPYNPPIDFTKTFLNNIIIIGLALGAFLMRNFVLQIVQQKPLWYVGTGLIFILCIGGTAYNMIHGVPNFKYARDDSTGQVYVDEYFQRQMRGQWAGEGYLAAMLILIAGIGFILTYYIDLPETLYH